MRIMIIVLICVSYVVNSANGAVRIGKKSKALKAIYLSEAATLQEKFAAEELQRYIEKAGGSKLAIKSGPASKSEAVIVVSLVKNLAEMKVKPTAGELGLGVEGISNRFQGNHLIIGGGGPRGIVYSAYNFLEHLGYRWYWPGELGEVRPDLSDAAVNQLAVLHEPSFVRRHAMNGAVGEHPDLQWDLAIKDWVTKNHLNFWVWEPKVPGYENFMQKRGGTLSKVGSGHNWYNIIPPKVYFKDHPEWFALVDGKRQSGHVQLCLTNPDVLKKLTEYSMAGAEAMTKDPDILYIDMTQNDGDDWCQCDSCRAIDDKDPDTHADIVLWAVNQVSDEVTAKYPNAKFFTYAYFTSVKPPTWIKPRKNIIMSVANYCINYGASFLNPNALNYPRFRNDIDGWAKIAETISVREYHGFYNWLEPYPVSLYRFTDEIPYLKLVKPVQQFYSETQQRWSTNHFLYYAFCNMWWDHTKDPKAMLEEFCKLFYGPTEKPMLDYYMTLETTGGPDRWIGGQTFNLPILFGPELRQKCRAYLDKAKDLAKDDETISARLAFVELGWRYTELHVEALEAEIAFKAQSTDENRKKNKNAWQAHIDYFKELEGTNAFGPDITMFRDRALKKMEKYSIDLSALPAGGIEYTDSFRSGGSARINGKVLGFYDGPWGLSLGAEREGSVTYEFGAEAGHRWTKAHAKFQGAWFEGLQNSVEYSLDGSNWITLVKNNDPGKTENTDITKAVAGLERFWIRCWYKNSLKSSVVAVLAVELTGQIE